MHEVHESWWLREYIRADMGLSCSTTLHLLLVLLFAGTADELRPMLASLVRNDDSAVATKGHRLSLR